MKYEIPFSATITVEAPNVVKAKRVAERCRLIGQCSGSRSSVKEASWRYEVDISNQRVGTPRRLK